MAKAPYKKRNYERPPRTYVFDPEKHCGRQANDGNPCTNIKGYQTDHLHVGPCKFHGGNVKPSVYTTLKRTAIKDALERVRQSDHDPMDLLPEVELLRAIVLDFHDRYEEFRDGIIAFKKSYDENMKLFLGSESPIDWLKARAMMREACLLERPVEVIDVAFASVIIDRVGRMVERIHKMKTDSALTPEMVKAYRDALVMAVIDVCTPDQITKISEKLEKI